MSTDPFDIGSPPVAEAWLAMPEAERISLIEDAHRRDRSPVGHNAMAHAALHVAAENRLASGHAVVVAAYDRFRAAGVSRHDTIHALASVVTRHMMAVLEQAAGFDQSTADRDFETLDPAPWLKKRRVRSET